MRKSTTHLKDVSRMLSTTVDQCRRTSHWRTLLHTFQPITYQRPLLFSKTMSTSVKQVIPVKRYDCFNLAERITFSDLDYAIQQTNADRAWSIFITLASRDNTIPMNLCCSLYALLNLTKKLAVGSNKLTKLRQRQLDQLLDYVGSQSSKELFLSSVQDMPVSGHKQLLRAIRTGDQYEAWTLFYRLHKDEPSTKLARNTCLKLMQMMMTNKRLDKNQLKMRLQLIALHGAGTSEYDSRYLSASDLGRLAHIYRGYQKNRSTAHRLIDEYVSGLPKKKQSHRADALDELIWRIIINGDINKAMEVLKKVQGEMADSVPINEMVFINLMNAYRRQRKYTESLRLFEQLLETKRRPTVRAFNAVLQIFAAQGSWERAGYIYESMIHLNVEPDVATYTEMIRVNAGHLKTCHHFYTKMLQHNIAPNVYTYSALIEASARRNDVKSVFRWFQTMLLDNVQPNEVVIACVLKSIEHNPQMLETVFHIASQASMSGIKTDAALYTILLKMQAESTGIEGALQLHRDMLAQSVEPNTYTYTVLVDACGKNDKPETAEKIFELMKKSKNHKPNTVTYSAMIDAWQKADRRDKLESISLEFLRQCKSDKSGRFWLDSRICNRLKSRCC